MTYYVDKNWSRYDAEAAQIYEETYPTTPSMLQRHDTIHRSIEIIMVPLCVRDNFLEMKQEWVDACIRKCQHPDCMAKFVRSPTNAQEIEELQRDLFHCLGLFVHRRNSVLPALAAEMYPQGTGNAVKDLRLFSDAFPELRDLYISTFEAVHHSLKFVLGALNTAQRGNPDDFVQGNPTSLNRFSKHFECGKGKIVGSATEVGRTLASVARSRSAKCDWPSFGST